MSHPHTCDGQFLPGQPKPAGSGRQKGTANKQTALFRAGLKSAAETLLNGTGENPVEAAFKIAQFMEGLAAKRLAAVQDAMGQLPGDEFDRIITSLELAAKIHLKLAEFAFPKLKRIDDPGEAPTDTPECEIVTLNIPPPPAWAMQRRPPSSITAPVAGNGEAPDESDTR
jgi:hypothetical protein